MKWMPILLLLALPMLTLGQMTYSQHTTSMKTMSYEDQRIHYIDSGSGPVLLLAHGVPTSSWLYRDMIVPLTEAGYRVIIPDFLGMGASRSKDRESDVELSEQGEMLTHLMTQLEIKKLSVAVHDAGGPWVWSWLTKADIELQSLILYNTILYLEGFNPPMSVKNGGIMEKLMRSFYNSQWIGKMIIRSTLKKGIEDKKLSKVERQGYLDPVKNDLGYAITGFMSSFGQLSVLCESARTYLQSNQTPICAIWGKEDPFLIGEKQLPLAMRDLNLVPQDVHIIHEAGHFVQEDALTECLDLTIRFLDRFYER